MIEAMLQDKYVIMKQIGVGGMSEVYCAINIRSREREMVTIKMLKPELFHNKQAREMFRKEAEIAISLNHKNTVSAYDIVEEADKMYIVLQFIDGINLKDYMKKKGALPEEEAIRIVLQIARALRYAHNNGYIHKDVKPQNILLDLEENAYLTDFGLAGEDEFHISENKVLGSVYYLSPEHAKGGEVTERSDIYSLGIVLYEMVTGRLPFRGENTKDVLREQLYVDATPPHQVNPKVSVALSEIIMKAIAKDPEYRYINFNNFIADVKKAQKNPEKSVVTMQAVPLARKDVDTFDWKKLWIGLLVIGAVFLILFGVSNMFRSGNPTAGVRMPNLISMNQSQATRTVEELGISYTIVYYEDEEAANGTVLHQAPQSGVVIEPGDSVEIGIVLNSQNNTLPDFANMKQADAYAYLDSLDVGRKYSERRESELPYGFVVGQYPAAGTPLSQVESVTLYLSDNQVENTVPDVKDLSIEKAKERLHQAGYGIGILYEEAGRSEVKVYSQLPEAGQKTIDVLMVDLYVGQDPNKNVAFSDSYDVSIKQDRTNVKICYQEDDGLIYLANEYKSMNKGIHTLQIQFKAYTDKPKTVYIYLDNVRRIVIDNVGAVS